MTEAKHTPGPWTLLPETFSPRIFVMPSDATADQQAIASVLKRDDARLIAAAPDMLEALGELQSFVAIMFGRGAEASIPETVNTPLGPEVKIGAIMRDAAAAISKATSP